MSRSAVALVALIVFAAVLFNVSAAVGVIVFACAGLLAQRWQSSANSDARGPSFEPPSIATASIDMAKSIVRHVDFEPMKIDPESMALELLHWLQLPDGRTGEIRASVLMTIWREMCLQKGWLDSNWRETAAAFRRLIGQPKQAWARHDGRSVVVYNVPDRAEFTLPDGNAEEAPPLPLHAPRVVPLRRKAA